MVFITSIMFMISTLMKTHPGDRLCLLTVILLQKPTPGLKTEG